MNITRGHLRKMIREAVFRVTEGEVVDMFSQGRAAILKIAEALAARAEEMLDIDGASKNVDVRVEPNLFLTPYVDIDGHGDEVRPVAQQVYEDYVLRKAGNQSHALNDILTRISIDYFDEPIEYALEALGDDRFTMPHTWKEEEPEMMTSPVSGDSDEDWIYDVEGEIETMMQDRESGKVVDLEQDWD